MSDAFYRLQKLPRSALVAHCIELEEQVRVLEEALERAFKLGADFEHRYLREAATPEDAYQRLLEIAGFTYAALGHLERLAESRKGGGNG